MILIRLILRALYWLHMRECERALHDLKTCMASPDVSIDTYRAMMARRRMLRDELAQARVRYSATFRPGDRKTWGWA